MKRRDRSTDTARFRLGAILAAIVSTMNIIILPADAATADVSGTALQSQCVPTSPDGWDPITGRYDCQGTAILQGTWEGTASFHSKGFADTTTGDASGTVEEHFEGSSGGTNNVGTLDFSGTVTVVGPDCEMVVRLTIVGGSGAFLGATGSVTSSTNLSCTNGSTALHSYYGTWTLPDSTPDPTPNDDQCGGPYGEPSLNDLARDVEMYESCSGFILDGYGGVHPVGGAQAVEGLPYFANFDIARELALVYNQTGTVTGGFVLDGWGGLHPFRTANGTTPAPIQNLPYFPGNDIARDAVLTGFNQTLGYYSGYMLDGRGGIHPFGGNTAVTPAPPYFNFDIARELVLQTPTNYSPGYILDGYGGMHPIKGAPALTGLPYFPGNDVANDALLTSQANSGYMLDGYGGIHRFGAAPAVNATHPYTAGVDRYKAFDLSNSTAGVVLQGSGKLWDFFLQ